MIKSYPTWLEYIKECEDLATLIRLNVRRDGPYDAIISVSRGGHLPGAIIANQIDIRKVYSVGVSFYDGEVKQSNALVYQDLPDDFDAKRILVVDDICDTGETFQFILKELEHMPSVSTACVYRKEKSTFIPNFRSTIIPDDEWIVLPYDVEPRI